MTLFVLTWFGVGCWCVCFWWMHRISSRQDSMLKELHEMTERINSCPSLESCSMRSVISCSSLSMESCRDEMRCIHQKQTHQQPSPAQVRSTTIISLRARCFDVDLDRDSLTDSRHRLRRLGEHQIEIASLEPISGDRPSRLFRVVRRRQQFHM